MMAFGCIFSGEGSQIWTNGIEHNIWIFLLPIHWWSQNVTLRSFLWSNEVIFTLFNYFFQNTYLDKWNILKHIFVTVMRNKLDIIFSLQKHPPKKHLELSNVVVLVIFWVLTHIDNLNKLPWACFIVQLVTSLLRKSVVHSDSDSH